MSGAFIGYGFASLYKEISEEVNSVYILSAVGIKGRHEFVGRSVILIVSSKLTEQVVTGLKHSTHQLRPDGSTYTSFPSGHTTTAFIGAEMKHQEFGFRSPWYSVAGYTMAGGTALLRVLNNRHWLSDVIAGAGIGMLSTKFCYWVFSKIEKKREKVKVTSY